MTVAKLQIFTLYDYMNAWQSDVVGIFDNSLKILFWTDFMDIKIVLHAPTNAMVPQVQTPWKTAYEIITRTFVCIHLTNLEKINYKYFVLLVRRSICKINFGNQNTLPHIYKILLF